MGAAKLQILHIRRRTAQPHSLSPPIFTVCQVLEESPYASLASTTIFRIRKNSDVRNRSRIRCKKKWPVSVQEVLPCIYIYILANHFKRNNPKSLLLSMLNSMNMGRTGSTRGNVNARWHCVLLKFNGRRGLSSIKASNDVQGVSGGNSC